MIKLFEEFEYYPGRTSVNQISYGLKFLVENIPSKINLDYGGGKYDIGTEYLYRNGIRNLIYDKFNRTKQHNHSVLKEIMDLGGADTVTLLNVLNVIRERENRIFCIKDAFSYLKSGGSMIITIYYGKANNIGELTKKITWQENRKMISYADEIKEALGDVNLEFYKKCIVVRKPKRIVESSDAIKTERGSVIKRSKYGVGKDIGDSIYVLNGYELNIIDRKLLQKFYDYVIKDDKIINDQFKLFYVPNTPFIIKIKKDFSSITLINSPDFNESDEPYIKDWIKINIDGKIVYGKANPENPPIYHHKWLFVLDNYEGFDVRESKRRSELWLSLPGIDFNRIGYKKYWEENIIPRIEKKKIRKKEEPFNEENWGYENN